MGTNSMDSLLTSAGPPCRLRSSENVGKREIIERGLQVDNSVGSSSVGGLGKTRFRVITGVIANPHRLDPPLACLITKPPYMES
jgi:hypothetical protein